MDDKDQCACLPGYDENQQCYTCDNGYFQSPITGQCILCMLLWSCEHWLLPPTTCTACGECVDKLVMMHNQSMQDVATLQYRLTELNNNLSYIYQQLNNVTLQAMPLMVWSLYGTVVYSIFPGNRIRSTSAWIFINGCYMIWTWSMTVA